jgi:hypothetical protein
MATSFYPSQSRLVPLHVTVTPTGETRVDGDIVERMRAEEADLLKKLEAVRAFLSAYAGGESPPSSKGASRQARGSSREKVEIEGFGGYGRKVVAEAMRMLLCANHPIRTSELIAPIEAMGVEITGQN